MLLFVLDFFSPFGEIIFSSASLKWPNFNFPLYVHSLPQEQIADFRLKLPALRLPAGA